MYGSWEDPIYCWLFLARTLNFILHIYSIPLSIISSAVQHMPGTNIVRAPGFQKWARIGCQMGKNEWHKWKENPAICVCTSGGTTRSTTYV